VYHVVYVFLSKANYDSNNDPSFLIEEDLDEDSEGQNTDDIGDDDDEDIAGFVLIMTN
jgi:hypothetical protein